MNNISISDEQGRIEKWDLLKALLIFLIILGHLLDLFRAENLNARSLWFFVYTFHVPCFLFVTGLFSKHTIDEKNYSKIFSYLIMYFFIEILISATLAVARHEFGFSLFSVKNAGWFALALFWYCLLTIFLKSFSKTWVLIASIILACFIGYNNNSFSTDLLAIFRTINFFPFFFAGYCIDPVKLNQKLKPKWVKVVAALVIVGFAVICYKYVDKFYFLSPLLTGRHRYSVIGTSFGMENMVPYGGFLRLAYYGFVALLCLSVIALIPNHIRLGGKMLSGIGRRTLQIFILQKPFQYILFDGLALEFLIEKYQVSLYILIAIAAGMTLFLGLPFWEKPIKRVIYPLTEEQRKQRKQSR